MEISKKEMFISGYMWNTLIKSKLPYGLQFLILRDQTEVEAKKAYKRFKKQQKLWNKGKVIKNH